MNIANKDINLLVLFVAIWQEKNLSKAAERLHLSQSAVSHALSRLREQFNDPLFVRSSKGVTPTDFSKSIAQDIFQVVAKIESLYSLNQKFNPEESTETLHLSIGDYFSSVFLERFISNLKKEAPKVKIICLPDSEIFSVEAFERGDLHLGITGFSVKPREGFHSKLLVEDSIKCCFRKNHTSIKKKLTLSTYIKADHMFVSGIGMTSGLVDKKLKQLKTQRNVSVVVPGFFEAGTLLEKSDLVLTAPEKLCKYLSTQHQLTVCDPPFKMNRFPVMMYWHQRTESDPFHIWIRQKVLQLASNQ